MITSFSLIFLLGLLGGYIFNKIKIPSIIGMLIVGIFLGPYGFNLLDKSILNISSDLRKIALVIILIKAGLTLNLNDLKKVGKVSIFLSFIPATFEIVSYIIFAPLILGISKIDSAIMGAVCAAVSPAVVVPRMVNLIEKKYGTKKAIPQMILAGASCDDIFVIVLFTTFISIAKGESFKFIDFFNIPISIFLGIILGGIFAYFINKLFEKNNKIENSVKVIIILGISFLLISIENILKNKIAISGLIAIMSMALFLKMKASKDITENLSYKFSKIWIFAEICLFVLVGAEVNISYTLYAGFPVILIIVISLIIRSLGVLITISYTKLNIKERLFVIISYLPKATVQAAIGAIPLSIGLKCGKLVLSVAILGIILTAPIGAIGIDYLYKKLLKKE